MTPAQINKESHKEDKLAQLRANAIESVLMSMKEEFGADVDSTILQFKIKLVFFCESSHPVTIYATYDDLIGNAHEIFSFVLSINPEQYENL